MTDSTRKGLDQFFAVRRTDTTKSVGAAIDSWLDGLPKRDSFNLYEGLFPLAIDSAATWLDVPGETAALVHAFIREVHFTATGAGSSRSQTEIHSALLQRGLVRELCAAGLLERESIFGFLCDTAVQLFAIPAVVCNALAAIATTPDMLGFSRKNPAAIPRIFSEAMRLMPMWFSMRRRMHEPLRYGDNDIPEDATVEVFLAKANRDPSVFRKPYSLSPERRSSPPLLSDNDRAAFTRLADNTPWGAHHILFDISAMVLQKMLTGPLAMEFRAVPSTGIAPMPSGDLLQIPTDLRVQMG